jgi:hypothetical protein
MVRPDQFVNDRRSSEIITTVRGSVMHCLMPNKFGRHQVVQNQAARTLVLRHLPNLQKKYGPRLSAALEGLWRAVTMFEPGANGLWAYVQYEVLGQVVRQRETLGFGETSYAVLYSDAAPLGVSRF